MLVDIYILMINLFFFFYGVDTYRNGKRRRRSKNGRFFTDHHHRSKHRRNQFCDNSPSPISNPPVNNAAIQAELNDYLACILSCLSKYYSIYLFIKYILISGKNIFMQFIIFLKDRKLDSFKIMS